MFTRSKLLFLTLLRKTYNLSLVRRFLNNYVLIFPKWLSKRNLHLYLFIVSLFIFWLYYEIFRVSPVCAYYTGPDFPSLLNKFKSVGKTYRPTIYLFSSRLQWLFLKLYCRLELLYKSSRYRTQRQSPAAQTFFHKLALFLDTLFLKSFLFRKIFKAQAPISLREVVEGHNGSLVVLDWYLPKWVSTECKTCGLFKHECSFNTSDYTSGLLSKLGSQSDTNASGTPLAPIKPDKADYFKMYTIESINMQDNARENDSDAEVILTSSSESSSSSLAPSSENPRPLIHTTLNDLDPGINSADDDSSSHNMDSELGTISEQRGSGKTGPEDPDEDGPNPKIIRGVLVIIGDMNIAYRICSTRASCYCNTKDYDYKPNVCETCNENYRKDHEGFNVEHPGFPTLRSLVNDALRSGFVCVHLHLNVNLGMASEAFTDAVTLRSFPISLYSDVLVDLDCALNKVSERFPNASLVTVGISFGANILMEYLAVSAQGGAVKVYSDSDPENFNDMPFPLYRNFNSSRTDTYEPTPTKITDTHPSMLCQTSDYKNIDILSDYSHNSRQSENFDKKSHSSTSSLLGRGRMKPPAQVSGMTVDSLMNMDSSKSVGSSKTNDQLIDDHFGMDLNREEYNTESKIVFPDQSPQLFLNPDKIAAAVCINLNLRLSGNVLYNISKRKFRSSGMYKRFCVSSFKEQLCALLNNVHCRRTNTSLHKDCINFNCCHYNKVVSKFGLVKKLFYRIFFIKNKIKANVDTYSTEKLIAQLHREYRQSYRDLRSEGRDFINYGTILFKRLGLRSCSDFKVAILMTLRHRFEREGVDGRVKFRQVTDPPVYRCVNKRVNTNLRIGKSVFLRRPTKLASNVHRILDYKITKYINNLINSDYTRNLTNIKENMEFVKVPTLLLYSLDNSMFSLLDIDIFEVIKNPNIVYYIAQSGGFSTFLSGIRPSTWFIGPVLEFLEEMSTKSKTF